MLTPQELEADVHSEIDAMFVRLAKKWGLKTGDTDPMTDLKWDQETVPAIVRYVAQWYMGNRPREEVTVILSVPEGDSEGIDELLADRLDEDPEIVVVRSYAGNLVADHHHDPHWSPGPC
jgi:hypothetical protein